MGSGCGAVPTRHLGTVLVVLAVVLAGCVGGIGGGGGGNGDGTTATTATTGTDGTDGTSGTDSTDGTTESDGTDGTTDGTDTGGTATTDAGGGGGFGDYEFSEGDTFVYSAALTNTSTRANVRWTVTDVSGDQLTVEVSFGYGGNYGETKTFEGTKQEVFDQLSFESDHLGEVIFLSLRIGPSIAAGHSLSVGNTWTVAAEDLPSGVPKRSETLRAEVTGTAEYGGVECTNVQVTNESGSTGPTYCVNPEYPFSLATNTQGVEGTDVRFEGTSTGEAGGETTTTTTTTTTSTPDLGDVSGEVRNDLDGLAVVDHRIVVGNGTRVEEGKLAVFVTVENTGDQPTEVVFGYSYDLTVYGDSGEEIFSQGVTVTSGRTSALPPGERVTIALRTNSDLDPGRIARYEIRVSCESLDDGVYCG